MKTFFKLILLMGVLVFVLGVVGGTALWHEASQALSSHPGITVSVNGEALDVQGLAGMHDGVGGFIGLVVAGLVMCVVVPLVLLFGIGLPLLIVSCVLVAVFSIGAVVFSPFVLFILLLVWLVRRKSRRGAPQNRPNITA